MDVSRRSYERFLKNEVSVGGCLRCSIEQSPTWSPHLYRASPTASDRERGSAFPWTTCALRKYPIASKRCPAFVQRRRIKLAWSNGVRLFGLVANSPLNMSDSAMIYVASLCATVSLAALVLIWRYSQGSRPSYPPGPIGYPLIGSVLDIPRNVPIWKGFISIAEKFCKSLILAGGHLIQCATVPRHRCIIHEVILNGIRRPEQLRSHLRPVGEAVHHLLR